MIKTRRPIPGTRPPIYPIDNAITRLNPLAYWPMIDKGDRLMDTKGLNHLTNFGSIPNPDGRYFDGVNDYSVQFVHDIQQGILSYLGNDTTTAKFQDDGQNFEDWVSSMSANYMLVVTNDDTSITWGYCGEIDTTSTDINIYTDIALTTRGWKGAAPIAGAKNPSTYEIRRTDFQLTNRITVGFWIKPDFTGLIRYLFSKQGTNVSFVFLGDATDHFRFYSGGAGGANAATAVNVTYENKWYFVVGCANGSETNIYVNGFYEASALTPLLPKDTYAPVQIGGITGSFCKSIIGDAFILNRTIYAVEIQNLFQDLAWKYEEIGR